MAFGYKIAISDNQKSAIEKFYANYKPDADEK